jgi:hypothetical protein
MSSNDVWGRPPGGIAFVKVFNRREEAAAERGRGEPFPPCFFYHFEMLPRHPWKTVF